MYSDTDIQTRKSLPALLGLRGNDSGCARLLIVVVTLIGLWFRHLQFSDVLESLGREYHVIHQPTLFSKSSNVSFGSILMPFPSAISRSARSIFSKNSSFVISVGSSFLAASFWTYLISFFSAASLSSSGFISRNSSARSCTAVIMLQMFGFVCKDSANREKCKINRDLFLFPRCSLSIPEHSSPTRSLSSGAQRYEYFPRLYQSRYKNDV